MENKTEWKLSMDDGDLVVEDLAGLYVAPIIGPNATQNANLIAASPELLEALQELLSSSYVTIRSGDLLFKANSVINKALNGK